MAAIVQSPIRADVSTTLVSVFTCHSDLPRERKRGRITAAGVGSQTYLLKEVFVMKMKGFITRGANFVKQQAAKSTARPNGYYMSRKRRQARGLIVGVKTVRGGRGATRTASAAK